MTEVPNLKIGRDGVVERKAGEITVYKIAFLISVGNAHAVVADIAGLGGSVVLEEIAAHFLEIQSSRHIINLAFFL